MVQINLLPAAAKKKPKVKIDLKVNLGPLVFGLAGVILAIIVIWSILGLRLSGNNKELAKLETGLSSLQATLQKLNQLNQDKTQLFGKLEFLEYALKRDVLWAKNLNRISTLLPSGIWLKSITLQTAKEEHLNRYQRLDIDGSAVSVEGKEMINLIGGFMTALKTDEVLAEQFSEVKLVSSQRSASGKISIMNFKLICQFRKEESIKK